MSDLMEKAVLSPTSRVSPINVKQNMYALSPVTFDGPCLYDGFVW